MKLFQKQLLKRLFFPYELPWHLVEKNKQKLTTGTTG